MNRFIWATNYDFGWWKREWRVQFTRSLCYLFAFEFMFLVILLFIHFNGLSVRLCVGRDIFPRCHHARSFGFPPCVREMESFLASLDLSGLCGPKQPFGQPMRSHSTCLPIRNRTHPLIAL